MRVQILICRVVIGHVPKIPEAVFPEYTFRVLSPGAEAPNGDLLTHIVWSRNIAFKRGNLAKDYRLICLSDLIQIQESDNLLAIVLIIYAIAICIACIIIDVLTVEDSKIEVYRPLVTGVTQRMFNYKSLEGKVMRVLPDIGKAVKKRFLLFLETLCSTITDHTVGNVEVPDIAIFDQ